MFPSFIHDASRSTLLVALGAGFCALATSGCMATLRAEPPVVVADADIEVVEAPPVNIETYLRESYGGADVYLVGGRWYRRSGNGWGAYRSEPAELGRRRVSVEQRGRPQQAPPSRAPARGERHGEEHEHEHEHGH